MKSELRQQYISAARTPNTAADVLLRGFRQRTPSSMWVGFISLVRGWSHKLSAITVMPTIWPGPTEPGADSELAGVLMDGFEEG